jgi:phage shock protein C
MNQIDMKKCPYCAEEIKIEATRCKHCGSNLNRGNLSEPWYRLQKDKVIWGICAGLSDIFGISVSAIRLAFVLATLCGGWGLVIYIVLRFVMPLKRIENNPQ